MSNPKADHVLFRVSESRMECERCNGSQRLPFNIPISRIWEMLDEFTVSHSNCSANPVGAPPRMIYLQWYGDVPEGAPLDGLEPDPSDVSWSEDPVFGADVIYRRITTRPHSKNVYDFRPTNEHILMAIMQRFNLGEAAAIEAIELFDSTKLRSA